MKLPLRSARPPLFVARQTYRRRRLMDAARLLPVLGAVLFLMPLLWGGSESDGSGGSGTARAGMYVFIVWLGLIAAAFGLARGLRPGPADPGDEGG